MDDGIRASDRERDAAVEVLSTAVAEGRLSLEEFSARVDVAHAATQRAELARLTADLPSADVAGPSVAAHVEVVPTNELSIFGDLSRSGAWVVPTDGSWRTWFGDVTLDLREAHVAGREISIRADTVFGDIELLVPEGLLVEVRSRTVFGDVKQESGHSATAGSVRVVLTGRTLFGDVRVRPQRTREKLMARWRARHDS